MKRKGPSLWREKVGGGWNACSALVGTGDLSGDGTGLLARDTAGRLWRYASTGNGTYSSRALVGAGGWNTFKGLYRPERGKTRTAPVVMLRF
ncbi:hypothetical protein ACWEQW_32035 [Streptomyces nigra]